MATSLYRYVWKHTRRQQIWMLVVVLLSIPPLFYSLNIPKLIINGPIQGSGFEADGATQTYLRLAVPLSDGLFGRSEWELFHGIEFERIEALFVLSTLFLVFVVINGAFKYYLNIYKGRLGERMLRRMRYELVDRLLRFPMRQFRRLRPSEVASMVKDELEPIGGFIGDAFVQPLYLMSQILTAMVFIFVQSMTLGLVAFGATIVQVVLIPRMRRRLLVLGRQRQLAARRLAGSVGEIIESMPSIRTNDASNYVRAKISHDLGGIFLIRFDIYQWKFLVKFLNNFLSQATPFIFYMFGGYYAVTGHLDIGELVAVIAAYRELPSPLKDLIDWDLMRLDVNVKYDQVAEQFDVGDLADESRQAPLAAAVPPLIGAFAARGLTITDESGLKLVDDVSLDLPLRQAVAATGPVGDGAERIAEALASLQVPSSGEIALAGHPLASYPEAVTGRRLAYVDAATFYPQSTLREALLYPLMHHPQGGTTVRDGKSEQLARMETLASGNIALDPRDDWVDAAAIGGTTPADRTRAISDVLRIVRLDRDIARFGLRQRAPAGLTEDVAGPVLAARRAFRERLVRSGTAGDVEPFDPGRYLANASIIENVVFGASYADEISATRLLVRGDARRVLEQTGLGDDLAVIGRSIAETLVELFGDMGESSPLLRRLDIVRPDEIDDFRQLLARSGSRDGEQMREDRSRLIRLALNYVEPRYRLGLIDDTLRARIVEARRLFHDQASRDVTEGIVFYDIERFNPAANIQDNVIFGRLAQTTASAADAIEDHLTAAIEDAGLAGIVQDLALDFDIGAGAKRLTLGQQQKLSLARSILKAPDYLIANRCLSALDVETQRAVMAATLERGRDPLRPFGSFWVLSFEQHAELFDRIVRFERGDVAADHLVAPAEQPI
ncbi:ABC transporter ATP-binding protein [Aureimonas pseudogalii]|uniref:Putative ABC transport system ATP-binding protein n=1 Tax=Aureimonas pseudogalii TaxID=1744844 RepID=A0A7W6ECZ0_9HYPH|nr:ABC transporter ATP-binding protein [Aureimonas pseudogalii]MBB3996360.1 putative ABC transport system ATP-binding protein [Aureimonas pseudogalii]